MENINYEPYKLDRDKNGFLAITKENIARINFVISVDSKYREDFDVDYNNSVCKCIRAYGETTDCRKIETIVKKIDKINSTHQSVSGYEKGQNNGIQLTAEYISKIDNFYNRLKAGDADIVNNLAKVFENRTTLSFASKYCTYVSRYLYNSDAYSIYDNILQSILPYYAWVYLGENYKARTQSNIFKKFAVRENLNYGGYRDLIDKIRDEVVFDISRKDFDSLLWYYYKGRDDEIKKALECVGNENNKY